MSVGYVPEVISEPEDGTEDDHGVIHWVCHCTDDAITACGLDLSHSPLMETLPGEVLDEDCPLCRLAWPVDGCPWGCSCAEC